MNKQQLIEEIQKILGKDATKACAEKALNATIEAIKAGAVTSKVQTSIRLRYRTGITSGMRVVCGGVVYNILAVLPDLAGKGHVDLVCEVLS